MHKGIYKDKRTSKWYIHTSIKGKSCTIRGFNSKSEADEQYDYAIEKWKLSHSLSTNGDFEKAKDEYLIYRSKIVRKESLRKDKAQFKYYSMIFLNNNLNSVFNEQRLKIIYNNIIENKEFSSQKKMRLVLAFRDFAKFCYLSKYIDQSIYNMVLMVFIPVKENKQERKDKRYIPQSDFKALLSVINDANDNLFALAIFTLYSCGLRVSELLGLIGNDIDLENKKIKVCRQLQTNGKITEQLKTSNSYRVVPMNSELLSFMQNIRTKNNDRVFQYSHTSFKRKLAIYEENAKIPKYSCHEFRHTTCCNLAKKCENMSDVVYCAKILGHSVSVYLNTYCNHLDNSLEEKFFN